MKKLIYLLIILSSCSGLLNAQTVDTPAIKKIPTLNGHTFLSTSYLQSSFVATSLQADIGIGSTSTLKIPGIIIDDYEILSFEGKLLFVDLNVQYQQRFNPWLALFISAKMAGRLGTDMSSIMADGVNTIVGGNIGWLVRIKQTDKLNLSGTVSLNNITGNFINVTKYFDEIINNEPYPSVIKKVPAMTAGIGFRGAYAFSPTFGLQFNLDYAYGESLERGASKAYFSGGILGDVDFNPKYKVPVGLALGYSMSSAPEIVMNDGGFSNLFLGKIGYTGSQDFELGVQYTYYNVDLKSVNDKPFISKIMLTLKFYF